jgi:drug/metabolite transporter (DMT)-like permease
LVTLASPSPSQSGSTNSPWLPTVSLLVGAASWGILWYPFRVMEATGLTAPVATVFCYCVSVTVGTLLVPRAWREFPANWRWLFVIGLTVGLSNVAFLIAIMQANVVRIVLLFYLAPLWTVPFALWILRERLTWAGYATVGLAMAGAIVMLWRPELGFPAPRDGDEMLGLFAGIMFALCNVLVKRAHMVTPQAKSLAGATGVALVAIPVALWLGPPLSAWPTLAAPNGWLILLVGAVLMMTSFTLQYGLSKLAANRAAVILLFELIVAAVAAHYLADETTRVSDWIGGAMIVSAGMIASLGGGKQH